MNYNLPTFASIPLNMDPLSVSGWIARSIQKAGEPKSDWPDDYLEKATKHLQVSYDEASGLAEFTVSGVMWRGASMIEEVCYGLYNTDRIAGNMRKIESIKDVKGVVVNIDTPGGMARGALEAASAVEQYRARTGVGVVAWIPNIGASAGYYVASACDEIHANPAALVGSIGTMAVAVDSSGLYKRIGLEAKLYTGGAPLKGMGTEGVEWTKEWHKKLEDSVSEYRAEFIGFVRRNRPAMGEDSFNGDAFEARKAPPGMIDGMSTL